MSRSIEKPYISKNAVQNNRYQRYLYNLMRSGKAKTKEWLTQKIMTGRVAYHFLSDSGSQTVKQFTSDESRRMYLESFLGYLDKIEEQHEWDIHVHIRSLNDLNDPARRTKIFLVLTPMLKFDEFTIENSRNDEHQINELFVFFALQVTAIKDGKMVLRPSIPEGMRTLFHEDEYNSGYIHSHLTELYLDNPEAAESSARHLRTFCIGNDHQEEFISLLGANYDPHLFARFLMIIRTMVEWESLEGTPYVYMDSIHSREIGDESVPQEDANSVRKSAYPVISRIPSFVEDIDFIIQENHYEVKMTRQLEESIKNVLVEEGEYNFIAKRTNYGWVSYNADQAHLEIRDREDEVFIFGGQEYKLRLHGERDEEEENDDDINSYRIYPKFLNYVKQQISQQLYHHQVSRSFVGAED